MKESPIARAFSRATAEGRSAFIPFMTAGFPDLETCERILTALAENGADVIEIGLPFSDPMADGPTIQAAGQQALEKGMTPPKLLDMARRFASIAGTPMVVMTYFNPILRMGSETFAARAADSGISGVIIPDLPPEEADQWREAAIKHGLDTIFLVAPTTPKSRMEWISSRSSGFLYYVSMTGVTGSAFEISDGMLDQIRLARRLSAIPVAVGFGISTPDQAARLADTADGVIVGSAMIRAVQAEEKPAAQIGAVSRLAAALSRALIRGNGPHSEDIGAARFEALARTGS